MQWKKCNTCKNNIGFKTRFYICSVSTCTRKRTGMVFCSVSCWDAHLPIVRHRESWAEERKSPSEEEWNEVLAGKREDPTFFKEKPKDQVGAEEAEENTPSASRKNQTGAAPAKVILRRPKSE